MTDSSDRSQRSEGAREPLPQRALVGALSVLIAGINSLPTWLAYLVGDVIAVPWFVYWSLHDRRGRRSSGYWRNVQLAFREGSQLGPERPPRHLWRWSRHIAWILIDFCRMHRITAANIHEYCEVEEFERVREAFAEGHGLICATGHIGAWDVSGHVAGLLELPVTAVFRPSPIPALDRLIERLRTGSGQTVVARKKVMWTLKKTLEAREAIALLADGGGKHSAVVAPFLGTNSRTVATPALLHLATGAPIVVVAMLRTGRMRYRMRVFDVIRDADTGDRDRDLVAITTRVNRALGRGIAEAPEQWFWQSRRFRHRPTGEVQGADGLPPIVSVDIPAPPMKSAERHRSGRAAD